MNRTDGPWRIGRAISDGQRCIVGDGDSVIALLPDETMGCSYNADNAALLAHALDFFVALQEIAAPAAYGMDSADRLEAHRALARAALANVGGAK